MKVIHSDARVSSNLPEIQRRLALMKLTFPQESFLITDTVNFENLLKYDWAAQDHDGTVGLYKVKPSCNSVMNPLAWVPVYTAGTRWQDAIGGDFLVLPARPGVQTNPSWKDTLIFLGE